MASRSLDLGGLPEIKQGGFDLDALVKIANLMQNQHEMSLRDIASKSSYGTPARTATPDVTSVTKPWFAGARGFQEQPGTLLIPGGPGVADTPAGPSTWVKPGIPAAPATMGSVEFSKRHSMSGNVLTADKSDEELNAQAQLLYGEPGDSTLSKLKFSSKTTKPLHVISDLESQMLGGLGVKLEPGKVLTGDEFASLHRLIGLNTQGRMAKNQELILKKLGYDITNIQATIDEKATKIEKEKLEIERGKVGLEVLKGMRDKDKPSADPLLTLPSEPAGVDDEQAITNYLTSINAKDTPKNRAWAKTKIKGR